MNARDFNAVVQADISALVRAGERAQTCDHCRGTGQVPDWGNDGKPKHCPMCNGTGGPRVTRMAYNIHRG